MYSHPLPKKSEGWGAQVSGEDRVGHLPVSPFKSSSTPSAGYRSLRFDFDWRIEAGDVILVTPSGDDRDKLPTADASPCFSNSVHRSVVSQSGIEYPSGDRGHGFPPALARRTEPDIEQNRG